jgi:DNA repair exonuclease SbcCD nuclease subunit
MSPSSRSDIDEITILAIGDVHLGTRPGSLPAGLDEEGVDPRSLTPETALLAAVERAIEEGVDAVLFAGDVVESSNARFEAVRPLETAVRRLLEAGIPVLAVAGNHDVEALPRLAKLIDGFELLGEGGRWQSRVIERAGGPAVEILGWSFPEKQVRNSPVDILLRNPIAPARPGIPRIGLLHGDLDASGGTYAPFTSRELTEAGLDAWLLGHIHKPSLTLGRATQAGATQGGAVDGSGPRGYLGSLVGLDPGESGPHGPWLVRVNAHGEVAARQLVIAPLRWERFDVRVEEDDGPADVGDRLLAEIVRFGHELQEQGSVSRVLGLRPCLVGPTRHDQALRRAIKEGLWNGSIRSAGGTLVFIDKVLDELDLAHDLEALAMGDDPPALMARKLLILQNPSEERSALLEAARGALQSLANEPRWSPLDEERDQRDPLSDDQALAALLSKSATAGLSDLLSQRAGGARGEFERGADS